MGEKVVAITGGARGIGAACVRAFLAEGWRVAVCDLDGAAGERFVQELGRPADDARFYAVNVADEEKVEAAFKKIVADFGRIDATLVEVRGVCRDCAGKSTE